MPAEPVPADPGWDDDLTWLDRDPMTAAERAEWLDRVCEHDEPPEPEEYEDFGPLTPEELAEVRQAAADDLLAVQAAAAGRRGPGQPGSALAAVTADIPAGLIAGQPREPVRVQGRPPMSKSAKAGISVAVAAAAPAVLSLVIGPLAFVMFAPFYVMALLVAGAQILFTRYDKRSGKQLPPDPGRPADFPLTAG